MFVGVIYFSAARKDSDEKGMLVLLRPVAYVVLGRPHLVVGGPLVIGVDDHHLPSVHLDAVAGKDVRDEELRVRVAFDLFRQSAPGLCDSVLCRVDQETEVEHRECCEGTVDGLYVLVDLFEIADALLDLHHVVLDRLLVEAVVLTCPEEHEDAVGRDEGSIS